MSENKRQLKQEKIKKNLIVIGKASGIGILEAGICGGLSFLFILINDWIVFIVLLIWLLFGWFSNYLIKANTLEILSVMISIIITSFIIYFFGGIVLWFIPIIIGSSVLFWIISYTTKLFLTPKEQKQISENQLNEK